MDTYLKTMARQRPTQRLDVNPFNPKLIIQILPTIQEENDWVM